MDTRSTTDAAQAPLFEPEGAIDINNSADLRDEMLEHVSTGAQSLVLDLHDVRYIDSSGLSALVNVATALERAEGQLVLCNVDSAVMKVLEMTRLTEYFVLAPNREAALAKASGE